MPVILLADDSAAVRRFVTRVLTRSGYDTIACADGMAAYHTALAADVAPDIVVTDFDMPGLNGVELIERLRERYPALPAVVITGSGGAEAARSLALPAGNTVLLHKPFDPAALLGAVGSLLSGDAPDHG